MACTLRNSPIRRCCGACGSERDAGRQQATAQAEAEQAARLDEAAQQCGSASTAVSSHQDGEEEDEEVIGGGPGGYSSHEQGQGQRSQGQEGQERQQGQGGQAGQGISVEQRQRMEHNKARALQLRQAVGAPKPQPLQQPTPKMVPEQHKAGVQSSVGTTTGTRTGTHAEAKTPAAAPVDEGLVPLVPMQCRCAIAKWCKLQRVRKAGPTKSRLFWSCPSRPDVGCGAFCALHFRSHFMLHFSQLTAHTKPHQVYSSGPILPSRTACASSSRGGTRVRCDGCSSRGRQTAVTSSAVRGRRQGPARSSPGHPRYHPPPQPQPQPQPQQQRRRGQWWAESEGAGRRRWRWRGVTAETRA